MILTNNWPRPLLLLLYLFFFVSLIFPGPVRAAKIKAGGFQVFQRDGETYGRVSVSGDCLGGIPENDQVDVVAFRVRPGGAPPYLQTYYLSYYCPSALSAGHGNCLSQEQRDGYLCDRHVLWHVTHRDNRPWMDPACSDYLCLETAPFHYEAEFKLPPALFTGDRVIITAQLYHQWGGPGAYWSAAVYQFDNFFDGRLDCKLNNATVAKKLFFEQILSPDGGLTASRQPFTGLRFKVDCGAGTEYRQTDGSGILNLEVGACGCRLTLCDRRVVKEYTYEITTESSELNFLLPNDAENIKGLRKFSYSKFRSATGAVGIIGMKDYYKTSTVAANLELRSNEQIFATDSKFSLDYQQDAQLKRKLLLKKPKCGTAADWQNDQEKHLGQAEQIMGALNLAHRQAAAGPKAKVDPQAPPEQKFLTVLAGGDDLVVVTQQDMIRIGLTASQVDIHSSAILVSNDDGSYYINVLSGFAVVYNAAGKPFTPALGAGSCGLVSAAGDLVTVNFGLSPLPDFDRPLNVLTENGSERLNGLADAERLFSDFRQTIGSNEGFFTYQDPGGPSLAGTPAQMTPISFTCDDRLQLEAATPNFTEPVDIYVGIDAAPYGVFLLLDRFGNWTTGKLEPWRSAVKVVPYEILLPALPTAVLKPGNYRAYLVAVPAGATDFSRLTGWAATLTLPQPRVPVSVNPGLFWQPGQDISLFSGTGSSGSKPTAKKYPAADLALADAYVYEYPYRNWNNANWGGSTQLQLAANIDGLDNTRARTYIKFDLAALPAAGAIDRVELQLSVYTGQQGATRLEVFRATAPWEAGDGVYHAGQAEPTAAPGTISWNRQPAVDWQHPWGAVDLAAGDGPFSFTLDITELVRAWLAGTYPNYGLVLRGRETDSYKFYLLSSEAADADLRPALVVYSP
ncbi:MAG: DNRLRE domain-containing protein [Deltaproteobacteria bacterium]|nr:DNRLRE domain-containing protein [Deltaproteobacteria bacterium]